MCCCLFHGSDKSVAATWERLDVSRSIRIVSQRRPDPIYCEIQPLLEIDESLAAPYLPSNLFSGYQLTGMRGEQDQNLEWLGRKVQCGSGSTQLPCSEMEFEDSEPQQGRVSCALIQGITTGRGTHFWPLILPTSNSDSTHSAVSTRLD